VLGEIHASGPEHALIELGKFVRRRKSELHPDGKVSLLHKDGSTVSGSESIVSEHFNDG
jgi:hypothetical protein